ncbi:MAG: hypothetical protein QXN55_03755 [Candidatus Nitrosotenuis sp.]
MIQAYASQTMFSSPPRMTSKTYVNEEYGFRFEPPRGWMVKDDHSEGITLAPNKGNSMLGVFAFELPPEMYTMLDNNEKKKFEKIIRSMANMHGIEKTSTPKFIYYDDGVRATFSILGATEINGEKTPMKGRITIWISYDNHKIYFMMYGSDKSSYKTHLQMLQAAEKSFYVFPILD